MINRADPSLSWRVCWTGNSQTVYSVQSQNQISELIDAEIWEQIVYIGYCDVKHNARIDRASNEIPSKEKEMLCVRALSTNILSICFKVPCIAAWWLRSSIKPWETRKSQHVLKKQNVFSNFERNWYNRVIGVWSQVDPGSKVQEQLSHKKKKTTFVSCGPFAKRC